MLDDLVAGAHRLARALPEHRQGLADQMVYEAHAAHLFAKRFGRPHPVWGNGSLMARALTGSSAPRGRLCFACMAIMAAAVDRFRSDPLGLRRGLSQAAALC